MRARWLGLGTLAVGVLDITYAIVVWWIRAKVPPIRIWQSVASGVLGRSEARAGGVPTALLGGVLHFFIAGCMVVAYYLVSGKLRFLVKQPVLFGALYGALLFPFMNYVVLPLSAAPTPKMDWTDKWVLISLVAHAVLVGIPCGVSSALARRA
jgi:hypothetical protein